MSKKEKPEELREHLYKEELKNNPAGQLNDTINKTQSGMPVTSGMSLKELGWIIIFIILFLFGYGMYNLLF